MVDLERAIRTGDVTQNVVVDDEDIIYIPPKTVTARKIFAFGEVLRPGIIPLEGTMRIREAVARAGGLTPYAVRKSIFVVRGDPNNPDVLRINFDDIIKRGDYSQNIVLRDGDTLYVPRRFIIRLTDVLRDVRPFLDTAIAYSDMITSLDAIDIRTWHNVRSATAPRVRAPR